MTADPPLVYPLGWDYPPGVDDETINREAADLDDLGEWEAQEFERELEELAPYLM